MTFKIEQLKAVMDSVRLDAILAPIKTASGTTTFCNLNAYRVVQALGLNLFFNYDADRPMTANEMVSYMDIMPQEFSKFQSHMIAFDLVNKGCLVFAAQSAELHGHIAPIYPSANMITSEKWKCPVPLASNVGLQNQVQGVNYCFADRPDYYFVV